MDCTLATLVACFSWSGLYLDSGLMYSNSGVQIERIAQVSTIVLPTSGPPSQVDTFSDKFRDITQNPYGRLAVGYEVNFREWSARLELAHVSSVVTGKDRGVESVSLNVRWYPFR